jgi:peptidoglycan/xylan/chitin deacetylase (PgdA/CDA1 family)
MVQGTRIYVALTMDIEPNNKPIEKKSGKKYSGLTEAMPKLLDILSDSKVPCTWFITHDYWGKINEEFPSLVERMNNNGEIGCHVHFRRDEEIYYTNRNFQREIIERATNSLRDQGFDVKSFRGGNLFFDENTLRVLEQLNYEIDSSVLPGMHSKPYPDLMINHKECTSTKPYFPSNINHCIPGSSKILEIPISVHPYFHLNTKLVSFFIARSLSMPLTKEHSSEINKAIKKNMTIGNHTLLNLFAHPWNFLDNTARKLQYFEDFLANMKLLNAKFVTLKMIKKEYTKRNIEISAKKSSFNITTYDILKLVNPLIKCLTKPP